MADQRLTSHDVAELEILCRQLTDAYRRRNVKSEYATLREEAAIFELRDLFATLDRRAGIQAA